MDNFVKWNINFIEGNFLDSLHRPSYESVVMFKKISDIPSPAILIEADALEKNLQRMQTACDVAGVELWPHIKTHKLVPVLRHQLELGARGATCAKIGEAEAMLPSGVRRIFIAHSLADIQKASRLKALQEKLDQLILAVTSELQCDVLEKILSKVDMRVPVLMAVDTGLGREGARSSEDAARLAEMIRRSPRMELIGIYTHEGHAYKLSANEEVQRFVLSVHERLLDVVQAVGGNLPLWPGCSVTAELMAHRPGVKAVRPGSYVFGDLSLTEVSGVMDFDDAALSILTTVLDRPEKGLALIDAGSKVFSGDKTAKGIYGRVQNKRELSVNRVSEEHGFLIGSGIDDLTLGQRLRIQPAHVCPVVNLASHVYLVRGDDVLETWKVDARGRSD
jgi:D-serine deaminase-like pyridoxal phosphate-dependent protein